MTLLTSFGNSITRGGAVAKPFPTIIANAKGWTETNSGIDGAQAADCADAVYGTIVGDESVSVLAVGENDQRTSGGDSLKKAWFGLIHKALAAYLSICDSNKVFANSGGVSYSGTWASGLWGFGKWTPNNGATATFSITGPVIYIGMSAADGWTGSFSVTVDGVLKTSATCGSSGKISTVLGRTWAPFLIRIDGLSNTSHTVVITNTSATTGTSYIAFDWASAPVAGPQLYIGNITRMTSAGYSTYGGSDTYVNEFNIVENQNVGELFADGQSIYLVDSHNASDPNTDLSDGLHPTQAGYQKLANQFLTTINNFG